VNVTSQDASRLTRGQSVLMRGRDAPIVSGEAFAVCKGTLIALCDMDKGELVPVRVFHYA
jgi:tRNA pseudouridine55 synthase